MKLVPRKPFIAAVSAVLAAAAIPLAAHAATVAIQVNGNAVSFDQPPIERAGRVYVPLRGVFERLGASVVYANRVINATGNGHNVSLTIGSTSATVDGHSVGMDSPPFLVGSRTLVPLRFVAQALGATVDYNGNTRVVSINGGSGAAASTGTTTTPVTTTGNGGPVTLQNLSPARGSTVAANTTTVVSGTFSQNVDPNSVRILLDDRDITSSGIYVSPTTFQATLPTLPAGQHVVVIKGNAAAGGAFQRQFKFNAGAVASSATPAISGVTINGTPATDGQQVPSSYTISGTTLPGAQVQVIVGYQTSLLGGLIPLGGNTNSQTVQADGNGRFTATIDGSSIGNPPNYQIVLRAVNPANGAASQATQLNVHT